MNSYESVEMARKVRIELTETLKKGGFKLLKWKSNYKGVVEEEEEGDEELIIEEQEDIASSDTILGVKYSFKSDKIFFFVKPEKAYMEIRTVA